MNVKSLMLNKQVLLALGMIVFIGAVVAAGTGAFFSSQAAATGNVFTAGDMVLQLTAVQNGGSPASTKNALWDFDNMAPGGDYATSSVWLRNSGSIDGASLALTVTGFTANPSNIAKQMRIAEMTFDGSNLLEGGAGATIPEYEAPTGCDTVVTPGSLLTSVDNAVPGETICVEAGSYNPGTLNLDVADVTLVAVSGPETAGSAVVEGNIVVTADGVTVRGFKIVDTTATAILVDSADGVVIEHNVFNDFGDINGIGNRQALYLVNTVSNAVVQYNKFDGVRNGDSSVKAIYLGHTGGTPSMSNIEISNNIISNVESADKGGYGILVNAAGNTTGLEIVNNTFTNIHGNWMHAVGLEGNTSGAEVVLNSFSGLTADGADNTAVFFESNPSASSVVINQNNFDSNAFGVALHPANQVGNYNIDATNNWWGDFDSSDQVFEVNSIVDTSNYAGGPIAGLINGNDQNGNGFADLHDLRNEIITDITPGLDSYDGTNDKEFYMAVQLDGPSTGNGFMNLALEGMEIEFTLNQI